MPSEVADIKQFLEIARRKDASAARIKKSAKKPTAGSHGHGQQQQQIKFKIRCHRFLYTLVLKDADKADKLKQSLPPNMNVTEISKKSKKAARK